MALTAFSGIDSASRFLHPTLKEFTMRKLLITLLTMMFVQAASSAEKMTPLRLKTVASGEMTFCTEFGYAPFEYFSEGSKEPAGFDIELGNEIARRLGLKARWENVAFDGILVSLEERKCDAVMAGLAATPERKELVDFILYLQNNRAIVGRKGNPKKVRAYDSLCGLRVGAQLESTNYKDMEQLLDKCISSPKGRMTLLGLKDNVALKRALMADEIDVYNTAAANAARDVIKSPEQLDIVAISKSVNSIGIAMRKNDAALKGAVQGAMAKIKSDGTLDNILRKWSLSYFRLI